MDFLPATYEEPGPPAFIPRCSYLTEKVPKTKTVPELPVLAVELSELSKGVIWGW